MPDENVLFATLSPATMSTASVLQRAKEGVIKQKDRDLRKPSDVIIEVDEAAQSDTEGRKVDFDSEGSEDFVLTAELTKREQQRRKLKPISMCKACVEPGTDIGAEAAHRVFSPVARGGAFTWVDTQSLHVSRASSVDSEVEDILNRPVSRLKTLDSIDPNFGVWTPTTHHIIHTVSPLLNLRERELYAVSLEDRSSVSPIPKHIFTPITSGSDWSLSSLDDDAVRSPATTDNTLDNECGDHPLANNMRPTATDHSQANSLRQTATDNPLSSNIRPGVSDQPLSNNVRPTADTADHPLASSIRPSTSEPPLTNSIRPGASDHPTSSNSRPTAAVSPQTTSVQTSRHSATNDH